MREAIIGRGSDRLPRRLLVAPHRRLLRLPCQASPSWRWSADLSGALFASSLTLMNSSARKRRLKSMISRRRPCDERTSCRQRFAEGLPRVEHETRAVVLCGDHQLSGRRRREPADLTSCDRVAADLNTAVEDVEEALYAGGRSCSNVAFGSSDRSIIVVGTRLRVGSSRTRRSRCRARLGTREANDGHCTSADDLDLRLESSIPRRECDPQLENA